MGALTSDGSGRTAALRDTRDEAEETLAALVIQGLPGVGDVKMDPLVEAFGTLRAALTAPLADFGRIVGAAAADRRSDQRIRRRAGKALDWCAARGVRAVNRWSAAYPAQLANIPNPPVVIFLWGDGAILDAETVTIVGSRKATEYGRRVARDVALVAARKGCAVASGLALGIDGEAHEAALAAGGRTVAVLGSGLSHPHPPSHARLFHRIAHEGLLLSEFLPGEMPLRHHFPRRNRTLAALGHLVVVVEAAEKSGALSTATHAIHLGRTVLAVPGSIYAPMSRGTNDLLRDAYPLVTPESILEHLSPGGELSLGLPADAAPPAGLGEDALRVWTALEGEPQHVDWVAAAAGLDTRRSLVALSMLELSGWARQHAGTRFTRAPGRT